MSKNWKVSGPTSSEDTEFLNRIKKSLYYTKLPETDCLSLPVTELAVEFFAEVKDGHTLENLSMEEASKISKNTCVSPCTLVLALLYIERLKNCNPEYLRQVAPSKLFLISLMVASKFLQDDGTEDEVVDAKWAISGRITLTQIKKLEVDFLQAIDWTLFVRHGVFWKKFEQLERDVAHREMRKRGWCSYTELACLMDFAQLFDIARTMVYVSYIFLVAYVAGVMTLLGSCYIAQSVSTISSSGTSLNSEFGRELTSLRANVSFPTENVVLLNSSMAAQSSRDNLQAVPDPLIRDEADGSATNCSATMTDDDKDGEVAVSWQWWLNSTMTWLPEYCSLKDDVIDEITEPGSSLYVNDGESSFNLTQKLKTENRTTDEFAPHNYFRYYVSWKNTLGTITHRMTQHWKQSYHEIVARSSKLLLNY